MLTEIAHIFEAFISQTFTSIEFNCFYFFDTPYPTILLFSFLNNDQIVIFLFSEFYWSFFFEKFPLIYFCFFKDFIEVDYTLFDGLLDLPLSFFDYCTLRLTKLLLYSEYSVVYLICLGTSLRAWCYKFRLGGDGEFFYLIIRFSFFVILLSFTIFIGNLWHPTSDPQLNT